VRSVILKYSAKTLCNTEFFAGLCLSVTYMLWTFLGQEGIYKQRFLLIISSVPFIAGVARFLFVAQNFGVEEPEEFLISDRIIQVFGTFFLILLTAGLFINL